MDFLINNLAVLLTVLALAGIVGFFWACRTTKDMRLNNATYTGRISCKSPNKSNTPKPMATRKMWPKETCPH